MRVVLHPIDERHNCLGQGGMGEDGIELTKEDDRPVVGVRCVVEFRNEVGVLWIELYELGATVVCKGGSELALSAAERTVEEQALSWSNKELGVDTLWLQRVANLVNDRLELGLDLTVACDIFEGNARDWSCDDRQRFDEKVDGKVVRLFEQSFDGQVGRATELAGAQVLENGSKVVAVSIKKVGPLLVDAGHIFAREKAGEVVGTATEQRARRRGKAAAAYVEVDELARANVLAVGR